MSQQEFLCPQCPTPFTVLDPDLRDHLHDKHDVRDDDELRRLLEGVRQQNGEQASSEVVSLERDF